MTRPRRLHIVPDAPPLDVTLALRNDIMKRDWRAAVHVAGDRRAAVFVDDRPKRIWRG